MKILIKFATRSRPNKFLKCLRNIEQHIADKDGYLILVSADDNDPMMECYKTSPPATHNTLIIWGASKGKVDAYNRDINDLDYKWDILINTSDDMIFIEPGFDNLIRQDFFAHYPDTDGIIHYPDGNRADLITMAIIGRKYYERDNYIYNPAYESVFCDDEQMAVAKARSKYKFVDRNLFRHMHPAWGLAPMDEQYRQQDSPQQHAKDRAIFLQRKKINFGL